ncbi:hypothetical protein NBT05_12815 [Aquimarina sp. ERC-38]|uniref:T9SS type A sorting domain-containing protein n=1 Tax=Aquimarina sp. ERC-38 TaxID=2949996 RepID=UPI0022475195|nr:T9SS type A sorting domain-containing protein [Aquimarina sp. ERC-38]UZO79831.1 hypothetical protein NBT05_12815 [Aquimarina sp. ERC-38]
MKRLLLLLGMLLGMHYTYGQIYNIKYELKVAPGHGSYGGGCRNDIRVRVFYRVNNGREQFRDLNNGRYLDLNGGSTDPDPFSERFEIRGGTVKFTKLETWASRNWRRKAGGCGGSVAFNTEKETHPINSNCTTIVTDITKWWRASLSITIEPELSITKPGNRKSVIACVGEDHLLQATPGFTPKGNIYVWEFLDKINREGTKTPGYQAVIDYAAKKHIELEACNTSTDPDKCQGELKAFTDAMVESFNYSPKYTYSDVWRPIRNITRDASSQVSLRDIYPLDIYYQRAIGTPIDIRIKTSCDKIVHGYQVTFLPEPPKAIGTPDIIEPTCSYTDDARFTLFFDRQINRNEKINIALRKKFKNGTYETFDSNDNIRYFDFVDGRKWSYTWKTKPNIGKELVAGDYEFLVAGVERNAGSNATPTCDPLKGYFTIEPTDRVQFNATKLQDETCFNLNNGQIELTASGGSETYSYILNGTNWVGSKTFTQAQSPFLLRNLPPGTYNIQVRDSNACYDKESSGDTNKVVTIRIEEKQELRHQIITSTTNPQNPGAPGLRDGVINITSVSGGSPKKENGKDYYDYVVLLNGSSVNTLTGRGYANGFRIDGLGEGNHRIRYTDANGCSVTSDLPQIRDPQPITYTLTKSDPSCADANDGELKVSNIQGGYPNYVVRWTRNGVPIPGNITSITGSDATYTLTITDQRSGRAYQDNIRFDNVPLPIIFTQNIALIQCYGEKAAVTITARGGKPPYQYGVWSGTQVTWYNSNRIELPASTGAGYRFQVRERYHTGCDSPISRYYPIRDVSQILIDDSTIVDNKIFGDNKGSIKITVTGGKPPYTIRWSKEGDTGFIANGNTITGLTYGYYIPTITDNTGSCTVIGDRILVDQPDELIVTLDVLSDPIRCFEESGTITATVTGGSENYAYTWYLDGIKISGENGNQLENSSTGNYSILIDDGYTTTTEAVTFTQPDQLGFTIAGKDVLCYDGSDGEIHINATGGTLPYYYSIDNKQTYTSFNLTADHHLTNLIAGTYEVWLKDANDCEPDSSQTIEINQPGEVRITLDTLFDVTRRGTNDGFIEVSITGVDGPYTVEWTRAEDPSFLETSEDLKDVYFGTYTLSILDQKNCGFTQTYTVREPLPMQVALTIETPVLCYGDQLGELLANVTGGFPIESTPEDFSYQWFQLEGANEIALNTDTSLYTLSNLPAGWYKLIATDAKGVVAENTIEITQPDDLIVTLMDTTNVLCYGEATGSIKILVEGGPKNPQTNTYLPYTYQWTKEEDPGYTATTANLDNITAGTYNLLIFDDNLCTTTLKDIVIDQPKAPLEVTNVVATNLTGFQTGNGSISMEVIGGTPPYTYQWTNADDASYQASTLNIQNLSIGNYTLVVTDTANCSLTFKQQITEPDKLISTINPLTIAESVQCHGGNTIQPLVTRTTGGFGAYSYAWYEQGDLSTILYTGADTPVVPAGTYKVIVTDENGNIAEDVYRVEEPDALEITEKVTHLKCNNDTDGRIDVTVSGGVAPYTYVWSNGTIQEDLDNLRAGSYTLRIKDANGCILSKVIEVVQPGALFANITRTYPSSKGANDGNIHIEMIGGTPPFTYNWKMSNGSSLTESGNILNNTSAGKYAVTITDVNNCMLVIDDVDLFEPPALEVTVAQNNVISCFGNTTTGSLIAVVEGGVPYNAIKQFEYQWYDATTNVFLGSDAAVLSNISAGDYYVRVTDAVGTSATSKVFTITEPEELVVTIDTDFINCGDQEDWHLIPIVQGGTPPYKYQWNTGDTKVELYNRLAGTYKVDLIDQRGCTATTQVTLVPPPNLQASHTFTIPTCYQGCDASIDLEVIGGTPPYQYNWSNQTKRKNLTEVCVGTYSVTVTDFKGCQMDYTIEIPNQEPIVVDLGEDVTLCKDQFEKLDASIADTKATYQWTATNGFTATTAQIEVDKSGTYTVIATNSNGCTATDTIEIQTTTNEIYTNFIANSQVYVDEVFVLVDISEPNPDTLLWEFPLEADVLYQDNDYAELSFDRPGEYEVSIQTSFGLCTEVHSKTIFVVEKEFGPNTEETNLPEEQIEFMMYPNPTLDGKFTVAIELPYRQAVSCKMYGIANNTLLAVQKGTDKNKYEFKFDMDHLPSGTYFMLFETSSGSQVHKLILE